MLRYLKIENFALIDHLEVEFGPGLNLFTGETGSGKSILVDAVGLLLGRRASQEMIREGFDRARVEGIFQVCGDHPVKSRLAGAGIEIDTDEAVIRREISLSGTNKVFVNGILSTQGFLAEIGEDLADIHGQYDQQRLLQPREHLQFLDAFCRADALREKVRRCYLELKDVRARLLDIRSREQERLRQVDNLEFQIQEIDRLQLTPGLDQELMSERQLLSTSEKRLQASVSAYQQLYESDRSILEELGQVIKNVEQLGHLDENCRGSHERLNEVRYRLEEVAFDLRDYCQSIEFNQSRLEAIESRLAEISRLQRKYGSSVDNILEHRKAAEIELGELQETSSRLEGLEHREEALTLQYLDLARELSKRRRENSAELATRVERELADLAMSQTVFKVAITTNPEEYTEEGIDAVEFLISPNPGESPKALAKIASGGELSRVILALKSILTLEKYPKTLIFDEVDAGLGGRVAAALGEKLSGLTLSHQVFCVTHLPQVAAFASTHYRVEKHPSGERTRIGVSRLDDAERISELARMLAGKKITEAALHQAREMLGRGDGPQPG